MVAACGGDTPTRPTPRKRQSSGGAHNSHNNAKRQRVLDEITDLMSKYYQFNEHNGLQFALCPICNAAVRNNRIPTADKKLMRQAKTCVLVERGEHKGGDINLTKKRTASAVKRMLNDHQTSGIHKFCAGLAVLHHEREVAVERALTGKEELVAKLFRTALHTVDQYDSMLSFESAVRLQVLNGADMGTATMEERQWRRWCAASRSCGWRTCWHSSNSLTPSQVSSRTLAQ